MSGKANPTLIGAFVVGAMIIAVAAVMILTGGQLFQKKLGFVMHFTGSVKGLTVGAPVTYRGVQIGTVKNIEIVLTREEARIPVTVEIDPATFTLVGYEEKMSPEEFREGLHDASDKEGLRAQLQMQSLLTGQLFIQLDYFPGTPARFLEADDTPEIPTIPTTLQELGDLVKDIPVKKILDDIARAAASLAELAEDKKIREAIQSVDQAFKDMSTLVNNLDTRTQPLQPALIEAQQMLVEGRQTLVEGRQTLAQATSTLVAAKQTFVKTTETLAPIKSLVADDSELLESIDEALAALTEAAQAIAALADTLERRPEAVLKGKGVFGDD